MVEGAGKGQALYTKNNVILIKDEADFISECEGSVFLIARCLA